MDEFSVVNSFVGEDWESECNDSTVSQAASSCALFDVHGGSDCETACVMFNDTSVAADNDDDRDGVKEECEAVEHCTDKREFVTDKKKVFVSNVNYRVSLLRCTVMVVHYALLMNVNNHLTNEFIYVIALCSLGHVNSVAGCPVSAVTLW